MEVNLSSEQLHAIDFFKNHGLLLINGGPGAGKTTVIKNLAEAVPDALILAPTGSAADRITNATGLPAHVFEKMMFDEEMIIGYNKGTVIFDEASMVSMEMLTKLMHCLDPTRLCLIGDCNQLPCVSGTPVFYTLLNIPSIPIVNLTINFRQKHADSLLVKMIKALTIPGNVPFTESDSSFKVFSFETDKEAIDAAAKPFMKYEDSQMLALSNNTVRTLNTLTESSPNQRAVCIENLYKKNAVLVAKGTTGFRESELLICYENGFEDRKRGGKFRSKFTPGKDNMVVCAENLYQTVMLVANGVTGSMGVTGPKKGPTCVKYDNGFVDRQRAGKFQSKFVAARAMTVHKSQGSEFGIPGIVGLSSWGGKDGMPRELIYTALSRFKESVMVFGSERNIQAAFGGKFSRKLDMEILELAASYKN